MTFDLANTKSAAAPINSVRPIAEHIKTAEMALSYLQFRSPFFSYIFYNKMRITYVGDEVPYAATDAHSIFLNMVGMIVRGGFSMKNVAFVIAHETAHYFLEDLVMSVLWRAAGQVQWQGQLLPYDHDIMNMAMDYRINAMLIDSDIGEMPKIGLYDKAISEKGYESCLEIYFKIYKAEAARKRQGVVIKVGFDEHMQPTIEVVKSTQEGGAGRVLVAAAKIAEISKGTVPGALRATIDEVLNPKVKWEDHLRSAMMRSSGEPALDWRYPDKRLITRSDPMYIGRSTYHGAGVIVLGGDTSGSIFHKLSAVFAEMNGIVSDMQPMEVHICWCDAEISRVDVLDEVEDLLAYKETVNATGGTGGGGGTDFRPVFKYIEDNNIQPDMLVYVTDLAGTFPREEPNFPVIWASIAKGNPPFGETVMIDLDA